MSSKPYRAVLADDERPLCLPERLVGRAVGLGVGVTKPPPPPPPPGELVPLLHATVSEASSSGSSLRIEHAI